MTQRSAPEQIWWSVDELVDAALPDLPTSKRAVNLRAEGWRRIPGGARRKAGRGGGWEYHWSVLPLAAQRVLLVTTEPEPQKMGSDAAWIAFDRLPQRIKDVAAERLACLRAVDALHEAGCTHVAAVSGAAGRFNVSERTIYNWLALVDGVAPEDRAAFLAPRHRWTKRKKTAAVDREFFALVKDDYLRPEQPTFTSCYDRAVRIAKAERLPVAPIHQLRRLYKAEVSKPVEIFHRKGQEALRRFFPHQERDKTALAPLECVQGDFHRFDVFVNWPGEPEPVRPQGVFFSDVHSGKLLVQRLSTTANSHTVQLAIGDMIERFGIPQSALLDNGREFAAKVITGGAKTRFRFKVRDDDIPGLLPLLGVDVHWATPYSGQSKPIERAFRDLCDRVAKHPEFSGAYTGNKPDAKPENYRSRAIDLDVFKAVLAQEVIEHNERPGRRSEVAFGRSFNAVFEEGYKTSPIRRATEEQCRLWLLSAEGLRGNSKNGEIRLHDNRYWSEWMYRIAGQKIVARFDPDALHEGIHIYDLEGRYLGDAACLDKGGFLNVEDARTVARERGNYKKAIREEAKAAQKYKAADLAARLRDATPAPEDDRPEAEIVRMVPPHPRAPKPERAADANREDADRITGHVTRLAERQRAGSAEPEGPEVRFARALEFEARLAKGDPITTAQADWLADYQLSSEYSGHARTRRLFGQSND